MKMEQRLVVPTGRAKMWDLLMDGRPGPRARWAAAFPAWSR